MLIDFLVVDVVQFFGRNKNNNGYLIGLLTNEIPNIILNTMHPQIPKNDDFSNF